MQLKRIKPKKVRVVDGDTVHYLSSDGWKVTVRVLGLDTDELNTKRGVQQKEVLESLFNKYTKPRLYTELKKDENGWPYLDRDAYGRVLASIKIRKWRWRSFWWDWIDYSDYMIEKKMVKKWSKWNTGSKK